MARRDMGKLVFLDLVDRSGRIQLLVQPERSETSTSTSATSSASTGRPGQDAAAASRRSPSTSSSCSAKIRRPLPDTFHGVTDVETRYRQRYLDLLMNEEIAPSFAVARADRHRRSARYLDGEGFLEVETPILQPRYGGAFAEPFVTHSNELDADLYLRIADELYLKRLIVGGLEKVYELAQGLPQREHLVQALARVHACSSGTRRTPTTATRWRASRRSSRQRPRRRPAARRGRPSAATRSTSRRRGGA